ncbi:hypothetical protein Q4S31_19895, partial [Morganella morganii]
SCVRLFIIHVQGGTMSDSCDSKKIDALEKRVTDLEKQLAETSQAANDKMETIKTHLDNVWMMVSKSPIA